MQAPADDLALQETLVPLATVYADIQPTYASTFYQSTQVDTPITHMVNIRWQNYLPTIDVVIRSTMLADGSQRSEIFRVRRSKEVGGRKRFIQLECELEHSRSTPDDSDWTRNALLTEPYDGDAAAPPLPIPPVAGLPIGLEDGTGDWALEDGTGVWLWNASAAIAVGLENGAGEWALEDGTGEWLWRS